MGIYLIVGGIFSMEIKSLYLFGRTIKLSKKDLIKENL